MTSAVATALARTGLVGHPSDGYGGATLSATLRNFAAHVHVAPAGALDIAPSDEHGWPEGGQPLVAATVARFARHCAGLGAPFDERVRIRYDSTIPREVGLGGSSAIVIATLRALATLAGVTIADERLPALALAVETEDLGIAAGLQDRVAQTYEGLVFTDFERGRNERLDAGLLPAMVVAWLPTAAGRSGDVHGTLRARHERGERAVVGAMANLARLARDARAALLNGDHAAFADALDAGYRVRAAILDLDARHAQLVAIARRLDLSATYTGSGGAVAVIAPRDDEVSALTRALEQAGARVAPALF